MSNRQYNEKAFHKLLEDLFNDESAKAKEIK